MTRKSAAGATRKNDDCADWYKTAFSADYLARYASRSDDAAERESPFIVKSLGLPTGARVLDLCCGAGRHSRALAEAGFRVTGLDLSMDLLQAACRERKRRISYVRGDMRKLPFHTGIFDGGINIFTSFGYFRTDAENLRSLQEASRVLRPGVRFVFDFFNSKPTLRNLVARSEKMENGMRVIERRSYKQKTRRIEKIIEIHDGAHVYERNESVRAYTPRELASLFKKAGFKVLERFGGLDGSVFDAENSPRIVFVAVNKSNASASQ